MKSIISILACAAMLSFAAGAHAQKARPVQTFDTSAGPVKITPVYHASLEIEAGGRSSSSIRPSRRISPGCRKPT